MNDADVARYWEGDAEGWIGGVRGGYDVYRYELNTPAFMKLLGDVAGKAVLDMGCGEGYVTRQLAERGGQMVGVDVSKTMIAAARISELQQVNTREARREHVTKLKETFAAEA